MRILDAMGGIGAMTEAGVDGLKTWPPYAERAIPTSSPSGPTTRTPASSTSRPTSCQRMCRIFATGLPSTFN